MPIVPDTKNWTWVLERPCPDCGFDAGLIAFADVPRITRDNVTAWIPVLERADVRVRPDESTWSPLEYSAHVRDVFRVFAGRLRLMLDEDDPEFENWDQDATAIAERYAEQNPAEVAFDLRNAGLALADAFERVPQAALGRTGRRSDGSVFTVETLALYYIHDPLHHLWDVSH
ncbi:DinB family protein [Humibacter sp. RRB41]|uniref:DinB family protein n=1 Tax=Humibacter sp. RRB41 TaxID=2919946 RepID=UPI001FAA71FD|nr:DinB family protein [Humibacter sp. RRB41]